MNGLTAIGATIALVILLSAAVLALSRTDTSDVPPAPTPTPVHTTVPSGMVG